MNQTSNFPTPKPCPMCGQLPPMNNVSAISGRPVVACMNICCKNFTIFEGDTLGEALGKWDAYCINEEIRRKSK